jgi:hypothetical protein
LASPDGLPIVAQILRVSLRIGRGQARASSGSRFADAGKELSVAVAGEAHLVDQGAAAACEAEDRGVVLLALKAFAGVVVAGGLMAQTQNAKSESAFFGRWLPRRERCAP